MRKFLLTTGFLCMITVGVAQDFGEPSQQDDMSFISEDKVWEYITTTGYYLDPVTLYHMRFDGSLEVNGHTYSKFVNYEAIIYKDGLTGEGVALPEERLYAPSYYREEGKTVYMLMEDWSLATGEIDEATNYSEVVMMDFSLQDGDIFPDGLFDEEWGLPLYVRYVESDNALPDPARKYFGLYSVWEDGSESMHRPIFAEGLGVTTSILPNVMLYWTTGMTESYLFSVRQGEDIIYKYHWYDYLWGANSVECVDIILPEPELRNGMVCLQGEVITVFDVAGRKVAEGMNEVCVTQLPHGTYVARGGARILKFIVK